MSIRSTFEGSVSSLPVTFEFIQERLPTDKKLITLTKRIFIQIEELPNFSDKNNHFFLDRVIRWVGCPALRKEWIFYSRDKNSQIKEIDVLLYDFDASSILIPELRVSFNKGNIFSITHLIGIELFFKQIAENNSIIGFEQVWRTITSYHQQVFTEFKKLLEKYPSDPNRQEIETQLRPLLQPLQISPSNLTPIASIPYPGSRATMSRSAKYDSNCHGPLEIEEFILEGNDIPIKSFEVMYNMDESISLILCINDKDKKIKSYLRHYGIMLDIFDYHSRRLDEPAQLETFYHIMTENNDCCPEFMNLKDILCAGHYAMTEEQKERKRLRIRFWK